MQHKEKIMKNNYNDQKVFSNMEMPWQKIMELNIKTMQCMDYMKPGDLLNIKKPEEFFEKNMNMFLHNSNMVINHVRDTLNILENHILKVSHQTEESALKAMRQASSVTQKSVVSAQNVAKNTVSHVKKSVKGSSKKVTPNVSMKAKSPVKKVTKAANKSTVQQSKSQVSNPVKSEVRAFSGKEKHGAHAKDVGQNVSKSVNVNEKNGVKDLGLLNKGK